MTKHIVERGAEAARTVVEALNEVIRTPYGALGRMEQAFGRTRGYWVRAQEREDLRLSEYFAITDFYSEDPGGFINRSRGVAVFDRLAFAVRPSSNPKDPVVRAAIKRSAEPDRRGIRLGEKELRELDLLRDEDPKLAVQRSRTALELAGKSQIARLLAIYGSARRVEARLDYAIEALQHAAKLAECDGDRADIYRRLGIAYAFSGDHSLGLLFAREAAQIYRLAGDVAGKGRSLVDQGTRYFHLGRLEEAGAAYQLALEHLPKESVRHRFGTWHSLALIHHRHGRLTEALRCLELAEDLVSPLIGPGHKAPLLATKAEILIAEGNYSDAERCYVQQLEIYTTISPLDAALVAVDLVRAQILGGRMGQALETIQGMAAYLDPLTDNLIASQVILQFVRLAIEGQTITVQILDRVADELEKSRAPRGRSAQRWKA